MVPRCEGKWHIIKGYNPPKHYYRHCLLELGIVVKCVDLDCLHQFFKVIPTGMCHVKFKSDGHHFTWRKPITTIHNILLGSLYVDQVHSDIITLFSLNPVVFVHV